MKWLTRLWNWIRLFFVIPESLSELKSDCHMSYADLLHSLRGQFSKCAIFLSDNKLRLIYMDDIHIIDRLNVTSNKPYKPTVFDCEDFSFTLKGRMSRYHGGFAFGIVYTHTANKGDHALCCFINQFGQFYYYEPQSNKVFKDKEGYEPFLILI